MLQFECFNINLSMRFCHQFTFPHPLNYREIVNKKNISAPLIDFEFIYSPVWEAQKFECKKDSVFQVLQSMKESQNYKVQKLKSCFMTFREHKFIIEIQFKQWTIIICFIWQNEALSRSNDIFHEKNPAQFLIYFYSKFKKAIFLDVMTTTNTFIKIHNNNLSLKHIFLIHLV